eukprot:6545977-Lingulodinium_polyedra.AAC.1
MPKSSTGRAALRTATPPAATCAERPGPAWASSGGARPGPWRSSRPSLSGTGATFSAADTYRAF